MTTLRPDCPESYLDVQIIRPEQVGKGRTYRSRGAIFRGLERGQTVAFLAVGEVARASVRGQAYNTGLACLPRRRFRCVYHPPDVVVVERIR